MTRSTQLLGLLSLALILTCASQGFGQSVFPDLIKGGAKSNTGGANSNQNKKLEQSQRGTNIFPTDLPKNDPPGEVVPAVKKVDESKAGKRVNVKKPNIAEKTPAIKPVKTSSAVTAAKPAVQQPKNIVPEGVFRATVTAKNGQRVNWTLLVDKNQNVACEIDLGGRKINLQGKCRVQNGACIIALQMGGDQFTGSVNWQNGNCFTIAGGQTRYTYYRVDRHCP